MPATEDYKVELEVFEGPLDLLLYLIRKEEVDIYDIPIERITSQYMEYLTLMRMLDLNIAGEFLVMAATLMMIKSRMLLPVDERPDEQDEEDDPRWDLVRRLVEYKKFKDAAAVLQDREIRQENIFGLGQHDVVLEPDEPGVALSDVSLFDLISAFNNVLKRAREEEIGTIVGHRYTVADKMDGILQMVGTRETLRFTDLFEGDALRQEVICTFLALLELLRLRQVRMTQKKAFGDILIQEV